MSAERAPDVRKIAEMLPQAVESMKEAEGKLAAVSPDGALPPEHKALQILQKAEEEYETQISVQQGGGGGGGGGSTHRGQIRVMLVPRGERTRTNEEISIALRRELQGLPGVAVAPFAGAGAPNCHRVCGNHRRGGSSRTGAAVGRRVGAGRCVGAGRRGCSLPTRLSGL